MNKSARLRKYEKIYKKYIKDVKTPEKKQEKQEEKIRKKVLKEPEKKRSLNEYQKFVQNEIKKEKYKNIPAKERMKSIASDWEKKKKGRKGKRNLK